METLSGMGDEKTTGRGSPDLAWPGDPVWKNVFGKLFEKSGVEV